MPHVIKNFINLEKLGLDLNVNKLFRIKLNIIPTMYPIAFAVYKFNFAYMRENMITPVTPVFKSPTIIYLTNNLLVDTLNPLESLP